MNNQSEYILKRNRLVAKKTVEALNKRFFDACYVETKEQALAKAVELTNRNKSVSWGGSITLEEIGLIKYLKENNYNIIDRNAAKTREEKLLLSKQALTCGSFFMSSNSISMTGELVNIDGVGNRVSALIFGPDNVIVVAGVNKIMPDLDSALKRAREYAAPVNIQRISALSERKTPCSLSGTCHDCTSPDSICSNIVITRLCLQQKRIKVILVGENLGF